MKTWLYTIVITVVAGLGFSILPHQLVADDFNPNMIVSDDEFTDTTSMSAAKIQEFLQLQSGVLKNLHVTVDGADKTAAQVIYDAAVANNISPKVLLTTIQKESSMLSRSSFSTSGYSGSQQYYLDWIMFYGWCDSCSSGSNKGFVNQINSAAAAFRRYLNAIAAQGYTISYWGPGMTKSIACISSDASRGICVAGQNIAITPANAATAALYTYTPHPGGNKSFWSLWNSYGFGWRRLYPDGSLLRAKNSSVVYLIQNGVKRAFVSNAAFLSRYSYSNVITVNPDHLFFYENGRSIKFANYSLLKTPRGGIYLLVDDTIRAIPSRTIFRTAGFSNDEVVKVTWNDIASFPQGPDITAENIYPSGRLLQNKKSGVVYYVKDGVRHGIPSREIYKSQFGKRKSTAVAPSVLDTYTLGEPVGFKDGELVVLKAGGTVYFISNGQKLPIESMEVAKAYKFDLIWKNLIRTNQASLDAHPTGPTLTLTDATPVTVAGQ